MDKKDMKKLFIVQYVIIGLLVVVCLFLVMDRKTSQNNISGTNNVEKTNNDYDVSMMNEVSVSEILTMFKNKKSYVLYIGRSTCGVCKNILPKLQEAQDDIGYVTQYLDITKVDRSSDDWKKLERLMDIETSINVTNEDGESEMKTESYGYFIGTYGYTPSLIIINNNKMIAGHIGNFELSDLKEWLQTNGID